MTAAQIAGIFQASEGILTFFFIVTTVTFTYGEPQPEKRRWLRLVLPTGVFALCFRPLEILYGYYWLYILMTLTFALLYCFLFLRRQRTVSAITVFYLMYSVVAVKPVIISLISPDGKDTGDVQVMLIRLCLYLAFVVLFGYYYLHPIAPRTRIPKPFWLLFAAAPLLIIAAIETMTRVSNGVFPNGITLMLFAALFAALLMDHYLCYTLMRTYESQLESSFLNQKLSLQLEHARHTSAIIAQVRKERHELKNNYFYIRSLVQAEKYGELTRFLDEEMGRRLELTEEFHTGNRLVDYILTQKVTEARAEGIHIVTCAMLPPDLRVREEDLCALLMNLLDNALEASRREEQGDIQIHIGVVRRFLSIQIRNRCSADVLEQNPELITRKQNAEQHGIGLKIVQQTAVRYKGFFQAYMESGYFVAAVMLPDCTGTGSEI